VTIHVGEEGGAYGIAEIRDIVSTMRHRFVMLPPASNRCHRPNPAFDGKEEE
jgi:hypothetical protein